MSQEVAVKGTQKERQRFTDVYRHYLMAQEDLDSRLPDWNRKDELFRTYINESNWPYQAVMFDPRVFTAIFEKTSRLLANKPRGRMIPREGGDTLGAKINNELLSFQWDDSERVENKPMITKWAMMDQNARKYGASFALCPWRYENRKQEDKMKNWYDGPYFKPLINRDCLPNPSYSTIKNWFQHRDYLTIDELERVNDAARSKPIYKNLDILREAVKKDSKAGGDTRESNWSSRNKSIKGLTDYLGQDEVFKTIEVITEYRPDRWISFAPKHGVIIRDIPNPYKHGQIPVVMLKYYEVDDDLYGLSEIEPVEKLQRGANAIISQYMDAINMSLYTPLKVRSTGVNMATLEFGPGKKWLMDNPESDVLPFETSTTGVTEFVSTYRFLIGAIQEGFGESSAIASGMSPGEGDKTATEIKDTAAQRLSRDNFNQIYLSEAIKKQMMFWHSMNQQFLFSGKEEKNKIIRIVGKDALRYFKKMGLGEYGLTEEGTKMMSELPMEGVANVKPEQLDERVWAPVYPIETEDGIKPKFNLGAGEETGELYIEPEDLTGNYDYIPDIESMALPTDQATALMKKQLLEMVKDQYIAQKLVSEGYNIKIKELLEDMLEDTGLKDADKYFERQTEEQMMGGGEQVGQQTNQVGGTGVGAGQPGMGNGGIQGMAGLPASPFGGQGQEQLARPQTNQR
jgi:hypothetical protein